MPLPRILSCLAVAALVASLGACQSFPGLEAGAALPPSAAPVELLPLDDLIAQADGGITSDASAAALAARAARLQARAAAMRAE